MSLFSFDRSRSARPVSGLSGLRFPAAAALFVLPGAGILGTVQPHPSTARATSRQTTLVPIFLSMSPATVAAGSSGTVTVTISQASPAGGTLQVSCTQPRELTSPSGSWPYELSFAPNVTSASFRVTAPSSAPSSSSITVPACQDGLDISNPATWQATTVCAVTAAP